MKKVLFLLVIIVVLFQSCTTSKSLAKKAKKLEDVSQYQAASDLYFQSIRKNPSNVDAILGMKRTGSLVLNDYLSKFSKAKMAEDYKTATYTYLDAVAYTKKLKSVNVDLEIPEFTKADFKIIKNAYLEQEYNAGLKFIDEEKFSDAEQKFNEVYQFDKNYKEVEELRNIAFLEPYYRKAEAYKNQREYRKAYEAYQRILKRVPNYKNTKADLKYVLDKGRINIMILEPEKQLKFSTYTTSLKNYTTDAIINSNDPFIKLVDRENMDKILKEQELSVSGLVNEKDAVEVGELKGAQFGLTVNVTNYNVEEHPVKTTTYKGFERYREKYTAEGSDIVQYRTRYRPVKYQIHKGSRTVNMTVHIKIVSLKTGEIIKSKILEKSESSQVNYLTYSGNIKELFASKEGRVNTSYNSHNYLVELSKKTRTLKSQTRLTNQIYKVTSGEITQLTLQNLSK